MLLKYIRINKINKKYNNSTPHTLTRDKSFALAGESHIGAYIDKYVCMHSPEN